LAGVRPTWQGSSNGSAAPGTRHTFYGMSIGFYEGELLRRVDPVQRSLGRYFREKVAAGEYQVPAGEYRRNSHRAAAER
jgi:hypothetical protein